MIARISPGRLGLALVPLLATALASFASAPRERPVLLDDPTAPWPRSGAYVGPAECARCHEDEAALIAAGHHAAVVHSAATMGCETCHGPGARHAAEQQAIEITHPQKLAPEVQARLCGRCHAPEIAGHGGGGAAAFLKAGLGCTDCHFVHEELGEPPSAGVRFRSRAATLAAADAVPAERCVRCHPVQHETLGAHGHAELAADENGCTTCHGHGSRHAASGIGRLVSRPDRAADGVATCVGCHGTVDPLRAHWPLGDGPFLGESLNCFDCHRVHGGPTDAAVPAPDDTNALCASCHASAFADHIARDGVHAEITGLDAPLARGCAACHAGAAEHARAGGRRQLVESLRAAERATVEQACLQCHAGEHAMQGLATGAHARRDVSCTACHSPSPPQDEVRTDAERRCTSCHGAVGAEFRLPNRHPVGEHGTLGCSDCHDPHAARPRLRDLELRQERCVSCHRAYRGPFVFEHQASRLDGCVACHLPHGSSNSRLLRQATTQQHCIACHGDFPAFHDQTQGSVFTNCLNCHTQVHGSDHSRFFFR